MARSAPLSQRLQAALYYARKKLLVRRKDARSDPVLSQAPSISGTPELGEVLSVVSGVWSGTVSKTYIWRRNGGIASIGSGLSYTLVVADLGAMISLTEVARSATGFAMSSAVAVGPVVEPPPPPEEE